MAFSLTSHFGFDFFVGYNPKNNTLIKIDLQGNRGDGGTFIKKYIPESVNTNKAMEIYDDFFRADLIDSKRFLTFDTDCINTYFPQIASRIKERSANIYDSSDPLKDLKQLPRTLVKTLDNYIENDRLARSDNPFRIHLEDIDNTLKSQQDSLNNLVEKTRDEYNQHRDNLEIRFWYNNKLLSEN